ncbi:MAG: class D beta-lactamase [Chitinophagaceae bacterium]|nr:class D beta-lactamase [Chitinophagaceae bacterium]
MRYSIVVLIFMALLAGSCREARIHEKAEWGKYFREEGIDETKACFILRDNNHEAIDYYNKERCLERFSPASTFKIFNSLVALEIPKVPDEQFVIAWDSIERWNPEWNRDMDMRDAFKLSNVGYYQEVARRIGPDYMQHYLDTVNYGNKSIGGGIDLFWLNDSLKISADEQVGFVKRLYFNELPFSERTQRIVRSMMIQEQNDAYKLSYKTGWYQDNEKNILWVVGYIERIEHVKEHENAMNKSDIRMYPYFFALNFEVPRSDESKKWSEVRISILKNILKDFGAMPSENTEG